MKDGVEGVCNEYGRRDMHTDNWRGILKEGAHLEDLNIDTIKYKNGKVIYNLSLCNPFSHIGGVDVYRLLF